jgi:hypothetical protein
MASISRRAEKCCAGTKRQSHFRNISAYDPIGPSEKKSSKFPCDNNAKNVRQTLLYMPF